MIKYKVLWIDDDPKVGLTALAIIKDIEIIKCNCYASGVNELNRHIDEIDAVIMDVNCLETNDQPKVPSVQAFGNYWSIIDKICTSNGHFIPWFVYTGSDYSGAEHLGSMIPIKGRPWDDRQYYNKSEGGKILLENVIKAIENTPDYKVKKYYSSVFDICPSEEYAKPLLDILKRYEENNSDTSLFVEMRKLMEAMAEYLRSHGFVWESEKGDNDTRLGEAKSYLTKVSIASGQKIVPGYISWGFAACYEAVNKGSHNNPRPEYNICKLIQDGKAPFLIRSTLFELLNFLHWAFSLPQDSEAIAKLQKDIDKCLATPKNKYN